MDHARPQSRPASRSIRRRRWPRAARVAAGLLVAWLGSVVASPTGAADADGTAAAGRMAEGPRHLIVISVDTLRPDHLGCYGYGRPTSPAIDRLASEGALWEQAWATSPWTKPSHASLLTGRYPARHGAVAMADELAASVPHLAEWLGARGFETFAVVNASWLKMHGLERGFQSLRWLPYVQGRREGSPVTRTAIDRFASRDPERRLFALVHYMDVHSDYVSLPRHERQFLRPYDGRVDGTTQQLYRFALGELVLSPADRRNLVDRYDAGIRQIDERIGGLLDFLRSEGLLDESLVVFTSDHGEEFGEHGGALHGHTQHEEVLRVPLVLRGPGVSPATRFEAPVSLVDVMPTVLEQLGVPAPPAMDGVPLALSPDDVVEDRSPGGPWWRLLFSEADVTFPPPSPGLVPVGPHRAVRAGRFKLRLDTGSGGAVLHDLEADPGERKDVRSAYPEVAALLEGRLRAFLKLGPGSPPPDPLSGTERRLLDEATATAASGRPRATPASGAPLASDR